MLTILNRRAFFAALTLSGVFTAARFYVPQIIQQRNVSPENSTITDTALHIANKYVLPGMELSSYCSLATNIGVPGIVVLNAASLGLTCVYVTINWINPEANLQVKSPFKDVPVTICKGFGGGNFVCNVVTLPARATLKVLGIGDSLYLMAPWGKAKPEDVLANETLAMKSAMVADASKIPAKTLHQAFEGQCVEWLGPLFGYFLCGWTRSLFYLAQDSLLQKMLSKSESTGCILPHGHSTLPLDCNGHPISPCIAFEWRGAQVEQRVVQNASMQCGGEVYVPDDGMLLNKVLVQGIQ